MFREQEVGVVDMLLRKVLGQPSSMIVAQLRLQLPVAIVSAFMNNTPVVAMLIPIVESWSEVRACVRWYHQVCRSGLLTALPLCRAAHSNVQDQVLDPVELQLHAGWHVLSAWH